jgi:hypothetical protein
MIQWPLSRLPSSAAKQAGESKRGQHSQSIEPLRPTSAAFNGQCHMGSNVVEMNPTNEQQAVAK